MNLKRKYVFVYFNRIELCSTPEQAIYFINSLINPRSAKQLKCANSRVSDIRYFLWRNRGKRSRNRRLFHL